MAEFMFEDLSEIFEGVNICILFPATDKSLLVGGLKPTRITFVMSKFKAKINKTPSLALVINDFHHKL